MYCHGSSFNNLSHLFVYKELLLPFLSEKGNSEDVKCRVCVITESIIKPSPSPSAELALTQRAEP